VLPDAPVPEARSLIPLGERVGQPDVGAFILDTNPLERVIKEVKRRSDVVGIFPDEAAILRLVGAVLIEAHDEWQVIERRYFSEGSMAAINAGATPPTSTDQRPALLAS
jgi:putative transposase